MVIMNANEIFLLILLGLWLTMLIALELLSRYGSSKNKKDE